MVRVTSIVVVVVRLRKRRGDTCDIELFRSMNELDSFTRSPNKFISRHVQPMNESANVKFCFFILEKKKKEKRRRESRDAQESPREENLLHFQLNGNETTTTKNGNKNGNGKW